MKPIFSNEQEELSDEQKDMIQLYNCGLSCVEIGLIYNKYRKHVAKVVKHAEKKGMDLEKSTINQYLNALRFLKENPQSRLSSYIEESKKIKSIIHVLHEQARKVHERFDFYGWSSLNEEGLFQEGYFGLENALKKMNPKHGASKVINYVGTGIFFAMVKANLKNSDVSEHVCREIYHKLKKRGSLDQLLEETTNPALKATVNLLNVQSLEDLGNKIYDIPDSESQIGSYDNSPTLAERMQEATKCLSDKERIVLELRYYPEDCKQRTYTEIGKELGILAENVKPIEERALKKMHDNSTYVFATKDNVK